MQCKTRFKGGEVESTFRNELKKFVLNPALLDGYNLVLEDLWRNSYNVTAENKKNLIKDIAEMERQLIHVRGKFMAGEIDSSDYKEMKNECTSKIERLEAKLTESKNTHASIQILRRGLETLLKLDSIYESNKLEIKRELTGSIFPEKMTFDGQNFRTGRINEAARIIFLINSQLRA